MPVKTLKTMMILGASVCMLAACSVDQPGHLNPTKPRVQAENYVRQEAVAALSNQELAGMAKHYSRYGSGPLDLTVTYNPKSKTNTALRAGREAARLAQQLRAGGVKHVKTQILPIQDGQEEFSALVRYDSYVALPPEDCTQMPGLESGTEDVSFDENYRLGCSLDTLIARQIARPKDMLGRGQQETTSDGRRGGNIVETYRTGAPNEALEGESASGRE